MSAFETKDGLKKVWTCRLCGRSKFSKAGQPHKCSGGYRKTFKRAARSRGWDNCWTWRWEEVQVKKTDKKLDKPVAKKSTKEQPKVELVSIMDVFRELERNGKPTAFNCPAPRTAFEVWWELTGSKMEMAVPIKELARAAFDEAISQMND